MTTTKATTTKRNYVVILAAAFVIALPFIMLLPTLFIFGLCRATYVLGGMAVLASASGAVSLLPE